jgi:hypothetical protein
MDPYCFDYLIILFYYLHPDIINIHPSYDYYRRIIIQS